MNCVHVKLPTRRATIHLARALSAVVQVGDLIVLSGALGAGKTFLVRALARALGLPESEPVTSPTFALVQQFDTQPPLVHADLYRLGGPAQAVDLGLEQEREHALVVVEWGEPYIEVLGRDALLISLELNPRCAHLRATGARSENQLSQLADQSLGRAGR